MPMQEERGSKGGSDEDYEQGSATRTVQLLLSWGISTVRFGPRTSRFPRGRALLWGSLTAMAEAP